MGNQVGEPLTILSKTLNKRLAERGLLRSQDTERNRHTVRRTIEGARRTVLHMAAKLFIGASAQSSPLSHISTDAEEDGSIPKDDFPTAPPESTHKNGPRERPALPQDTGAGSIGTVGTVPDPTDEVVFRI